MVWEVKLGKVTPFLISYWILILVVYNYGLDFGVFELLWFFVRISEILDEDVVSQSWLFCSFSDPLIGWKFSISNIVLSTLRLATNIAVLHTISISNITCLRHRLVNPTALTRCRWHLHISPQTLKPIPFTNFHTTLEILHAPPLIKLNLDHWLLTWRHINIRCISITPRRHWDISILLMFCQISFPFEGLLDQVIVVRIVHWLLRAHWGWYGWLSVFCA